GDSRVYLHRGSELVQVTRDHSLQEELRAEGSADAERVSRNVITRALGSLDSRHDAWLVPIEAGMRVLICSDGLTTEVGDDDLRAVLTMTADVDAAADELVRRACAAGGRDNITVVLVEVAGGGSAPSGGFDDEDENDRTIERTRPGARA
ncbi:serine/threonine protein phosphatase, partial [Leucobacter sp. Ag1]|uniref:PP2C family protein-serine/threonine phosphatase n=2 Tax=Leucobacter TaxID=55968 RepID=UPI0006210C5F